MSNALEHVGSLYIENQRLLAEYIKLLELLQAVIDGDQPMEAVEIDHKAKSWAIVLGKEPEAEPTAEEAE